MFGATIIKASELFEFAEAEGIAVNIQEIIEGGNEDHFMWNLWSCFTVNRGSLYNLDWAPQVKEMVIQYMIRWDLELLVIVTGTDAHLTQYPERES